MTDQSDDRIIEQERKAFRRAMWALPVAAAVLVAVAAAVERAFERGLLPHWLGSAWFVGFVVGAVGSTLLLALVYLIAWAATPKAARSARILRKQIDDHNRRAQYIYLLLVVVIAFDAWMLSPFGMLVPGTDIRALVVRSFVLPVAFVFTVLSLGSAVCFGQGYLRAKYRHALNDEWMRAMRGRTAIVGYLLSMGALGAVYLVNLYRPGWNGTLLPLLLAAVVVIPAFALLSQEWRAGRGHD